MKTFDQNNQPAVTSRATTLVDRTFLGVFFATLAACIAIDNIFIAPYLRLAPSEHSKAEVMHNPWTFGWDQLIAILGYTLTALVATYGIRTFGRWKREQLETKRIDIAYEALAFARESDFVFEHIRSSLMYDIEWSDMPLIEGESESNRRLRGPFFAISERLRAQRQFFDRAFQLHPKLVAVFGPEIDEVMMSLHKARRYVEVAADFLTRPMAHEPNQSADTRDFYDELRADVWSDSATLSRHGDRVGRELDAFREGIEKFCRPIVNYKRQ